MDLQGYEKMKKSEFKSELDKIKKGLPTEQWDKIVRECKYKGLTLEEYFDLKPSKEPRTWTKTKLHNAVGTDTIVVKGTKSRGPMLAVVAGGSRFYNATQTLKDQLQEGVDRALSMQPVKQVEPTGECEQLSGIDLKRAIAMKYIRKYRDFDKFLKILFFKSKKFALSEKQCDVAIRIGKEYKVMEEEPA
jgi:hypothetical protein